MVLPCVVFVLCLPNFYSLRAGKTPWAQRYCCLARNMGPNLQIRNTTRIPAQTPSFRRSRAKFPRLVRIPGANHNEDGADQLA